MVNEPLSFEVRPILGGDVKEWERLRCALWPDGAADHYVEIASFFAGTLAEPEAVLVAITPDREMIGLAELAIRTDLAETANQKTGYIEGLYVIPEARFRGVARALAQASLKWAREQGCVAFASDRADRVVVDLGY